MKALELWHANLSNRAEKTQKEYSRAFQKFLDWSKLTADQLREMKYAENLNSKPWERNQVENLARSYIAELEKKEYTCSTQKLHLVAIKSFFEAQGLPLFLKRADQPTGCAFGSKVLSAKEIKTLKTAAEYLRDKALIMFLKDSGLRQSDLTKLNWSDLKDYGEGFMGFEIQTKKKKTKARGFVGPETTEILNLYKRKRLEGTQKLPPEENIEDHPVFALLTDPSRKLTPVSMSGIIGNIISLANLEGVTPHGLRKFWEQNMHLEKEAYQKQLNGRALNTVERAYYYKETPELFEMYKNNYPNLTIEKQEFREVEDRLRNEYEREIKTLRDRIFDLERVVRTIGTMRYDETKKMFVSTPFEMPKPDWVPMMKKGTLGERGQLAILVKPSDVEEWRKKGWRKVA